MYFLENYFFHGWLEILADIIYAFKLLTVADAEMGGVERSNDEAFGQMSRFLEINLYVAESKLFFMQCVAANKLYAKSLHLAVRKATTTHTKKQNCRR